MENQFSPDVEALIRQHMATGRYANQDDLLREALDALDQRSQAIEEDPAVIEGIRRGLADFEAGRYQSLAEFDRWFRAQHPLSPNG